MVPQQKKGGMRYNNKPDMKNECGKKAKVENYRQRRNWSLDPRTSIPKKGVPKR